MLITPRPQGERRVRRDQSLGQTNEENDGENTQNDTFSPCWMLNEDYQGKGYAYEAAHVFFDYLFREKGARRIYAYTEDNKKS